MNRFNFESSFRSPFSAAYNFTHVGAWSSRHFFMSSSIFDVINEIENALESLKPECVCVQICGHKIFVLTAHNTCFVWPSKGDIIPPEELNEELQSCFTNMETESANGNRASLSATSEIHIIVIVVLFVFSFLILAGNLLTIISVFQFTKRKNTLSLLIIALSLTEVLTMLGPNAIGLYMFFDKNKEFQDLFTLCRVQAWLVVFLRIAESLIITLLALDRVFLMAMPHFYHKRWKGKLFVLFFFGTWICAAFIATWPLLWLEGFHVSSDSQEIFCLFPYNSSFARFFVLFLLCLLVICCFSFYTIFSMSSKKSFSTKLTANKDLASSKQQIVGRDFYSSTKELSRMVALVVVIYFCCILPWLVSERMLHLFVKKMSWIC